MTYRDVIEIVVSTVAGFILGYATCRFGCSRLSERAKRAVNSRTMGVLVLAMMVLVSVLYYRDAVERKNFVNCQEAKNEAFRAAIQSRSQAASEVDDAQRVFLRVRADPNATEQQRIDSIHTYLAALDRIDSTRSDNPLISGGCR